MIAEHGDELRDKLPAAIELIKGALDHRDQAVRAKATEVACAAYPLLADLTAVQRILWPGMKSGKGKPVWYDALMAALDEKDDAKDEGGGGGGDGKLSKAAAKREKKKAAAAGGDAAAAILAEAKAREAASGGKKKKGPKTWESGGGKQAGFKARGSDNKYQGE